MSRGKGSMYRSSVAGFRLLLCEFVTGLCSDPIKYADANAGMDAAANFKKSRLCLVVIWECSFYLSASTIRGNLRNPRNSMSKLLETREDSAETFESSEEPLDFVVLYRAQRRRTMARLGWTSVPLLESCPDRAPVGVFRCPHRCSLKVYLS